MVNKEVIRADKKKIDTRLSNLKKITSADRRLGARVVRNMSAEGQRKCQRPGARQIEGAASMGRGSVKGKGEG